MCAEDPLDLSGIDPLAADLHLTIAPSGDVQLATVIDQAQVPGPVCGTGLAAEQGSVGECAGHVGSAEIARAHAAAADYHFTHDTDRQWSALAVHNAQGCVGQRGPGVDRPVANPPGRGPDGGLGGTVEFPYLAPARAQTPGQRAGQGFPARCAQPWNVRHRAQRLGELGPDGGRQLDEVDVGFGQQPGQLPRVPAGRRVHGDQFTADHGGQHQLQDPRIKDRGRGLRYACARADLELVAEGMNR